MANVRVWHLAADPQDVRYPVAIGHFENFRLDVYAGDRLGGWLGRLLVDPLTP